MAAMGEKAVALCGEIADGLMISNMCPPGYTVGAVERMRAGAAAVGRPAPATVVQYVLCAADKDRAQARNAVKMSMGKMLAEYWTLGERSQVYRDAMFSESGIPNSDFIAAVERLKAGDNPVEVLDDRFVDAYSISGNIDDCLAGAARFAQAGVTELVVTFVGPNPVDDIRYLGDALKGQKR
jgi:5,10-methylenetetrahydromethanopterin reductase